MNKTSSAIRLTHLPTNIVVQCQNERSQHQNRAMALEDASPTAGPAGGGEAGGGGGGEVQSNAEGRLRLADSRTSFFHPEQRVKDARTGFSAGSFHAVLDGNIQGFLDAYLRYRAMGGQG